MKKFTKIREWACPQCEGNLHTAGGNFNPRDTQLVIRCQESNCDFIAYLLVPNIPGDIKYEVKTVNI